MKKIVILITVVLLSISAKAQFFDESVRWKEATIEVYPKEQILFFTEYTIKGKTEIEGKEYFNLYCDNHLSYYIRETPDEKVYVYHPKNKKEYLVYDFNFEKDKVISYELFHEDYNTQALKIKEVGFEKLLDGKNYEYVYAGSKRIYSIKFIKGIGSTNGFFYHMYAYLIEHMSRTNRLCEFYKDDVLIYNYPVNYPMSIENTEESNSVIIYPQPSKNIINFKFNTEDVEILNIYDQSGILIKSYNVKNKSIFTIKNELNTGVYIYHIKTKSNKTTVGKFIITN
ncbi:T9SS type A sorting domain-containing protein [Vallitalea sp.]|jgi:hypothetical protein|uniref:T9SS type A sorting domain-containing protein n=1 Tax=Vallitalea sp. TaxID=1882829 RepID=UPI0025D574C1|nr:T9SS type A sorting domain-containing protein [Vallitalea sp.]MCT4688510.1 T9SS type A sorting domain-containing protein [Vallitalea sp.]